MLTSKVKYLSDQATKFYATKWSFIFFLTMITTFAILQIALFATGIINLNGIFISDNNSGRAWAILGVSAGGAVCGFIGGVYSVRGDLRFFIPSLIQSTTTIIIDIYSQAWLVAATIVVTIILMIIRFFYWKDIAKKGRDFENIASNKNMAMLFTAAAIWFVTTIIISHIPACTKVMYPPINGVPYPTFLRWCDVMSSTLIILATMLLSLKSRLGFICFFTNKIFIIAIFSYHQNIVIVVQTILYSSMDITGFLAWTTSSLDK